MNLEIFNLRSLCKTTLGHIKQKLSLLLCFYRCRMQGCCKLWHPELDPMGVWPEKGRNSSRPEEPTGKISHWRMPAQYAPLEDSRDFKEKGRTRRTTSGRFHRLRRCLWRLVIAPGEYEWGQWYSCTACLPESTRWESVRWYDGSVPRIRTSVQWKNQILFCNTPAPRSWNWVYQFHPINMFLCQFILSVCQHNRVVF